MCDDCSDTSTDTSCDTSDTTVDTSSDTTCDTSDTTSELPEDSGDLSDDGSEDLPEDDYQTEDIDMSEGDEELCDTESEADEVPDDGSESLPDESADEVPDDGSEALPDESVDEVSDDGSEALPDDNVDEVSDDGAQDSKELGNIQGENTFKSKIAGVAIAHEMNNAMKASDNGFMTTKGYNANRVAEVAGAAVGTIEHVPKDISAQNKEAANNFGHMVDLKTAAEDPDSIINFQPSPPDNQMIKEHTLVMDGLSEQQSVSERIENVQDPDQKTENYNCASDDFAGKDISEKVDATEPPLDNRLPSKPILKAGTDFEGSGRSAFDLQNSRAGQMKLPSDGKWSDERGNSEFFPGNKEQQDVLNKYGVKSVKYNEGHPDFSPFKYDKFSDVKIDAFGDNRNKNFGAADCAYAEAKGCTPAEARQLRHDKKLTWHELDSSGNMSLIPREVHSKFAHSGGVSEVKGMQVERAKQAVEGYRNLKPAASGKFKLTR